MSKEIVSTGNDFTVEQVDRGYGGARKTALQVAGADGGLTAAGPVGLGGLLALGTEGVQALSGAGAVDTAHLITMLTSTGLAQALTLGVGTKVGQLKIVHHTVDGGSAVLTPSGTTGNFSTFTFTNVHDACLLRWNGKGWDILLNVGGTIA